MFSNIAADNGLFFPLATPEDVHETTLEANSKHACD